MEILEPILHRSMFSSLALVCIVDLISAGYDLYIMRMDYCCRILSSLDILHH